MGIWVWVWVCWVNGDILGKTNKIDLRIGGGDMRLRDF